LVVRRHIIALGMRLKHRGETMEKNDSIL
jgi:hypothetical protein